MVDIVHVNGLREGRFPRGLRKGVKFLNRGVHGLLHAREAAFELNGSVKRCCADGPNGGGEREKRLPRGGHLLADLGELLPDLLHLNGCDARVLSLLVSELLELLLGARDLPLEVAVLLLGRLDGPVVDLALGLLKSGEFVFGVDDCLGEELLLLREERRVLRIELQKRGDALELALRLLDGAVHAFEGVA